MFDMFLQTKSNITFNILPSIEIRHLWGLRLASAIDTTAGRKYQTCNESSMCLVWVRVLDKRVRVQDTYTYTSYTSLTWSKFLSLLWKCKLQLLPLSRIYRNWSTVHRTNIVLHFHYVPSYIENTPVAQMYQNVHALRMKVMCLNISRIKIKHFLNEIIGSKNAVQQN